MTASTIGLIGVIITLAVNGWRTRRARTDDTRARAVAAVVAYREMPFAIRRRRAEAEARSGERVRLDERFSAVQVELALCESLMRNDPDRTVRQAYDRLVKTTRTTAGTAAHDAWRDVPITTDAEMNMGELFKSLNAIELELQTFERTITRSTD